MDLALTAITKTLTYVPPEPGQTSKAVTKTSDVTVLSTTHGQQRRVERNITRRDLQAAVLHGKKEKGGLDPLTGQQRWKYTFGDIVYITDATSRIEVKSYHQPAQLEKAAITQEMLRRHELDRAVIISDPTCITSHTIFVVDSSASMKISDVQGYMNRLHAVYSIMATHLIKKQLVSGESGPRDVASVVEMRVESKVLFECEPMEWILFNKMIDLASSAKPGGAGNYLPALDATERLLDKLSHGGCALLVVFLSDGRPSDRTPRKEAKGKGPDDADARLSKVMQSRVHNVTSKIGRRLNFGCIAIAENDMPASLVRRKRKHGDVEGEASGANQAPRKEFVVLQGMAEAAKDFSIGSFQSAKNMLGKAIVSLTTSLTSTKLELTAAGPGSAQRKVRQVQRERHELSSTGDITKDWKYNECWLYETTENALFHGRIDNINYTSNCRRFVYDPQSVDSWKEVGFLSHGANGIIVRQKVMAEGSERFVHAMTEMKRGADSYSPMGPPLVAKDGRYIEDLSKCQFKYHEEFCRSQSKCSQFAEAFNAQLAATLSQGEVATTPRITFLTTWVYLVVEKDGSQREVMAEKRLDVKRYQKFNNNAGFVLDEEDFASGSTRSSKIQSTVTFTGIDEEKEVTGLPDFGGNPLSGGVTLGLIPSQATLLQLRQRAATQAPRVGGCPLPKVPNRPAIKLGVQAPGSGACPVPRVPLALPDFRPKIKPSDIPQAFSHFTFHSSERQRLVCDLQGVYTPAKDGRPPLFELTDPVILHNNNAKDDLKVRRVSHGGCKRIAQFFESHKCNEVCRRLGLREWTSTI